MQTAVRAGVKKLFLFHHDPDHKDEKIGSMVERGRDRAAREGSSLIVEAASEGAEVILSKKGESSDEIMVPLHTEDSAMETPAP